MGQLEYFPAFFGYLDSLKLLEDAQVGRVFRAALRYAKDGTMPDLDAVEMMAFAFIRGDIDRAKIKYEEKCERLRANGMKGGRPPSENQKKPEETKRFSENQKEPEEPKQNKTKQDKTKQYNTNEGITSDAAAPAQKKTRKAFSPPAVEDVRTYCAENGYDTIDPEGFVDYYAANGWKVGNQPMKDWKATVRNWARRDRERGITAKPAPKPAETSFETDSFFEAALMRSYADYNQNGENAEK